MDILIFDHEPHRRQSLARGLRLMGYHVLEAETLRQAVLHVTCPEASNHLILFDCSSQMLNCSELMEAVRENRGDCHCVIMTDSDNRGMEVPPAWTWPIHFLQKPFTLMQLVYLIAKLRFRRSEPVPHDGINPMLNRTQGGPNTFLALRSL
jgi:DNA-binding NtrC family response regulator